ncbi:MAG: 7-carboxy-7-deazaguanine synthase QueE [Candidatus Omnitrophica bacterium]|nr:7-carboxy-7-deazaguanine synthase QueE [Candidatus Omnitrophota bacterium]MDD5487603.1 7-carboxy-7-deazaguanine synthase QueE [Candidatus Omnitrophota bacterium]
MKEAKISEIFLSYQGEGPYTGSRQLFIRFFGCDLGCKFCDTRQESYKTFTRDTLLCKVLDFDDDYNELSLTGGEPLMYASFLSEFLPAFRKHRQHKVYLETNGMRPEELKSVIDHIDIVSMDMKLPSSTGSGSSPWKAHKEFLGVSLAKEVIVKAVITDTTTMDDIKKMTEVLRSVPSGYEVVLQPVTPSDAGTPGPDDEMMFFFKEYIKKETGTPVLILGQAHKYVGIK